MASKGKVVADRGGKGKKRKRDCGGNTGGQKRKKNSGVLQFLDIAADEADGDSDSSSNNFSDDNDFPEDEIDNSTSIKNKTGIAAHLPFLQNVDDTRMEELENMLLERYKPRSNLIRYAEDEYETKQCIEQNIVMPSSGKVIPSSEDPTIWKVKCMVGRETQSAFCLMQKYVHMQSLGTELSIISAFALESVKGFLYIEAYKLCDVYEACKGLCSIYSRQVASVPPNEVPRLLVPRKSSEIVVNTWVRLQKGKYKGDLAKVVGVNSSRKYAILKIPRIDLQAVAEKLVGGVTTKKIDIPAQQLISSSDLEEVRPLIQYRHSRDTGEMFEVLDGMMLMDGYLYKRVHMNSLIGCGIQPSEDELLKFESSENEDSNDIKLFPQIYGDQKNMITLKSDNLGGNGKDLSNVSTKNGLEVNDMVFFSENKFGVIIGMENDDGCKVLTEDSEVPVLNLKLAELKKASFAKKFIAWDRQNKTISTNNVVRIVKGPLEGKQGRIKHIFGGTVFLYDETEPKNGGYYSCKAQFCEKIKLSNDAIYKKQIGEPALSLSHKSPPSRKTWPESIRLHNSNQEHKGIAVGQRLRLRVGPLKGYRCHVMAVWHSDILVKLDSQQKILTVKHEYLTGENLIVPMSDDPNSKKPFEPTGTHDFSRGTRKGDLWTTGGPPTKRKARPTSAASNVTFQQSSSTMCQNSISKGVGGQGKSDTSKSKGIQSPGFGSSKIDNCERAKDFEQNTLGKDVTWYGNKSHTERWKEPNVFFAGINPSLNNQDRGSIFENQGDLSLNKQEYRFSRSKEAQISYCNKEDMYGSWERVKTFGGDHGSGGRAQGGCRGGRDQFGRGRGDGIDRFIRGKGSGRGGMVHFGRGIGGGGKGSADQSGREIGASGTNKFVRGRGSCQVGGNQFSKGRGTGPGDADKFGRGRGSGRGGANKFGRGKGRGRGSSMHQFGRERGSRRDDSKEQFGRRRGSA